VCERCLPLPGDALECTIATSNALTNVATAAGGEVSDSTVCTLHRAVRSNYAECLEMRVERSASNGRTLRRTEKTAQRCDQQLEIRVRRFVGIGPNFGGPGSERRPVLTTQLVVFATDRPGLLLSISAVVTNWTLNIVDVMSKTRLVGHSSAFQFKVLVTDKRMLAEAIAQIEAVDDVVRVLRADIESMVLDKGLDGFWEHAQP